MSTKKKVASRSQTPLIEPVDLIFQAAEKWPTSLAFLTLHRDGTETGTSYQAFSAAIGRVGNFLKSLQLDDGDAIAVVSPNSAEANVAFYGAQCAGPVIVMDPGPGDASQAIRGFVQHSKIKVAIVSNAYPIDDATLLTDWFAEAGVEYTFGIDPTAHDVGPPSLLERASVCPEVIIEWSNHTARDIFAANASNEPNPPIVALPRAAQATMASASARAYRLSKDDALAGYRTHASSAGACVFNLATLSVGGTIMMLDFSEGRTNAAMTRCLARAMLRANERSPGWTPDVVAEAFRRVVDTADIKPKRIDPIGAKSFQELAGVRITSMPGLRKDDGFYAMTFRSGFPTEWRRCVLPRFGKV